MTRRTTLQFAGCFALVADILRTAGSLSGNLLSNADFAGGDYHGWILDPALTNAGEAAVDRSTKPISLRLSPNSRNTEKNKPFGLGQMFSAKSLRGQDLTVQGAMKSDGAAGIVIGIVLDGHGRPAAQAFLLQLDPADEFRFQKQTLKVPSNADHIIFGVVTNSTSGSVWFSRLYLGTGLPDAVTIAARPDGLGASISIDAARVLKIIPKGLFGTNVEWVRNGNSLWDPSRRQVRPEFTRLARELGVSSVRYPGGGFADYYHWRDGVGPPEKRPVREHLLDPGKSVALFGTHELAAFAQSLGAEPLMQANVITGTSAEAADWVAYCNRPDHPERTRNGSAAPFNIRYWEIGNEQYIKPDGSLALPVNSYMPLREYAAKLNQYASAMRAADAGVRLGAVGGRNFGFYRLVHDENWNEVLLTQSAGNIDFLSVHNAYAPLLVTGTKDLSVQDAYRAMFAFTSQVERNLAQVNRDIERFAGRDAARIKIAVTEWGPLFALDAANPFVDHVKTLGSALYVAALFQTFLRAARVEMLNFFKLTEEGFMGWINGFDAEPKPVFHALEMYSKHFGERLVDASVEGPVFESTQAGLCMPENQVPYLKAAASLNRDGSKLYLAVVNLHLSESIRTQIRVNGFQPASQARSWTLTGPGLDANNGVDMRGQARQVETKAGLFSQGRPGTVRPVAGTVSGVSSSFSYSFVPLSLTAFQLDAR